MKELSIEQKAQRYDKAIKGANELNYVSDKDSLQRKTVEHIFPELKESEDEKVEKAIFGMVYDSDNELWSSYNVSKSDVLDWLEKQGKQNLNAWTEEDEKQARQIERIVHNDGCSKKLQEQITNWFKSIKYRVQSQPQQEWNEEDTQYINDTLALLSFGYSIHSVGEVKEWLQSLNNRVQLKQEWSE